MRLAALDEAASAKGLFVGQGLSDARALCPALMVREIDRTETAKKFAALADWLAWATPIVGILADAAEWGDLMLDIAGAAHLFGGERALLDAVTGRLRQAGIAACGAVAPTVGAAWALAHFAPGAVVSRADMAAALEPLPVAALRLDAATVTGLRQMGLKRVGQLLGRDRAALEARFGAKLLLRLDQATGRIGERVVPRRPVPEHHAERRFAEPIALLDQVLAATDGLARDLAARLEAAGLGARRFELLAFRVDHEVMRLGVGAARPTRDPDHVARLFAHRAERLGGAFDAGFGIEMVRLGAFATSALAPAQPGLLAGEDGAADLERLHDRMASRLGPKAVLRSGLVDTHIPERAVVLAPAAAGSATAGPAAPAAAAPSGLPRRPLRLLPRPEEIVVIAEVPDGPPARMRWRRVEHRLVRAAGPERIAAEWWRDGPETPARDYFRVEDEDGRRFWIFRDGPFAAGTVPPRWYLHGLFA